jgi:hypothetical protein
LYIISIYGRDPVIIDFLEPDIGAQKKVLIAHAIERTTQNQLSFKSPAMTQFVMPNTMDLAKQSNGMHKHAVHNQCNAHVYAKMYGLGKAIYRY